MFFVHNFLLEEEERCRLWRRGYASRNDSLASMYETINKTMAKAMSDLKNSISKQLSDFQCNFQDDIKKTPWQDENEH